MKRFLPCLILSFGFASTVVLDAEEQPAVELEEVLVEAPDSEEDAGGDSAAKLATGADAAERKGDEEDNAGGDASGEEASEDPELEAAKAELKRLQVERDILQARNAIKEAELQQDLAEAKAEVERRKTLLEASANALGTFDEVAELKAQLEKAQLEASISKAQTDQRIQNLRALEEEMKASVAELRYEIERKEKEDERADYADRKPVYLEKPLKDGVLTISDRRIALNGVISMTTATRISERLNYFNNKGQGHPIFIVIDASPGGSVMAGYRILKAMESSEAPVIVVVKSYAASMAAVIAAMADESYAYPNAILLHHQLSGFIGGNVTQQRESLEETEEWWVRLAEPVAKRFGLTLEEFVDRMYEAESTGDWDEFATRAVELNWIDGVVEEIRETSLVKNPDAEKPKAAQGSVLLTNGDYPPARLDENGLVHTADDKGQPTAFLPRILPHDRWWLHNPDGYYRLR